MCHTWIDDCMRVYLIAFRVEMDLFRQDPGEIFCLYLIKLRCADSLASFPHTIICPPLLCLHIALSSGSSSLTSPLLYIPSTSIIILFRITVWHVWHVLVSTRSSLTKTSKVLSTLINLYSIHVLRRTRTTIPQYTHGTNAAVHPKYHFRTCPKSKRRVAHKYVSMPQL